MWYQEYSNQIPFLVMVQFFSFFFFFPCHFLGSLSKFLHKKLPIVYEENTHAKKKKRKEKKRSSDKILKPLISHVIFVSFVSFLLKENIGSGFKNWVRIVGVI